MRHEVTGKRPSKLSGVFRYHAAPGERLADWTRHIDVDWRFWCPYCQQIVLMIEEKQQDAAEQSWAVTRRSATHHLDRPHAWKVVVHAEGDYTVIGARATDEKHESFGPRRISEETLISWIEAAFERHYLVEAGHPADLVPGRRIRED